MEQCKPRGYNSTKDDVDRAVCSGSREAVQQRWRRSLWERVGVSGWMHDRR